MKRIKLNKANITDNLLTPISNISISANIKITSDGITTLVATDDDTIGFYCELDIDNSKYIEDDETIQLAIKDVSKLKRLFKCIPEDDFDVDIEVNHLKYSSPTVRFKYFFLEDGVIKDPPINVKTIDSFKADYSFVLSKQKIDEIDRMSSVVDDPQKVYIKFLSNGVYAETTDKTLENVNSVDVLVTEDYDGAENPIGFPIQYSLIKILKYSRCDMFKVKYCYERKAFIFSGERDKYTCKYMTLSLKN
jgi:hypothetical protein